MLKKKVKDMTIEEIEKVYCFNINIDCEHCPLNIDGNYFCIKDLKSKYNQERIKEIENKEIEVEEND